MILFIGAGPHSLGEKVAKIFEDVYVIDKNAEDNDRRYSADAPEFASQLEALLVKLQPSLVVNFVGAIDFQLIKDLSFDRFKNIWWTNMMPLVNCANALGNYEGPTHFIQIGSNAASYPFTGMFSYSVSKAAQKQAIKIMAKELAPRTRVNMVNPGPMEPHLSTMSKRQIRLIFGDIGDDEARERMVSRIPLRRLCDIDDLTKAILSLHSNTYLTGQVLELSGGQIL